MALRKKNQGAMNWPNAIARMWQYCALIYTVVTYLLS